MRLVVLIYSEYNHYNAIQGDDDVPEISNMNYQHLGLRIRQQRINLDWTQADLAKRIGVTGSFVGHIERAEKVPSLETVARLSVELGVTMDWLVFGIKQRCDAAPCALYADLDAIMRVYGFREGGDDGEGRF